MCIWPKWTDKGQSMLSDYRKWSKWPLTEGNTTEDMSMVTNRNKLNLMISWHEIMMQLMLEVNIHVRHRLDTMNCKRSTESAAEAAFWRIEGVLDLDLTRIRIATEASRPIFFLFGGANVTHMYNVYMMYSIVCFIIIVIGWLATFTSISTYRLFQCTWKVCSVQRSV